MRLVVGNAKAKNPTKTAVAPYMPIPTRGWHIDNMKMVLRSSRKPLAAAGLDSTSTLRTINNTIIVKPAAR